MKNTRIIAALTLAIAIVFTGCVKNEEADGVKAMREAQATLINAKAGAETTLAAAEAAYKNAMAAYENARAESELASARLTDMSTEAKRLENEIQSAKDAVEKAKLEARLEVALVTIAAEKAAAESKLTLAAIKAEGELKEAQQALTLKLRKLATELAAADNKAAGDYLTLYTTAIGEVQKLRVIITADEFAIAKKKITLAHYEATTVTEATKIDLAALETALAEQKASLIEDQAKVERLKSVVLDPSKGQEVSDAAQAEVDRLEALVEAKQIEVHEATAAVTLATDAQKLLSDEFTSLKTRMEELPRLISEKKDVITLAINSINLANTAILNNTTAITSAQGNLTAELAQLAIYRADQSKKSSVYNTAVVTYNAKLKARDEAQAKLDVENTTANQTALTTAENDLSKASVAKTEAWTKLEAAKKLVNSSSKSVAFYESQIKSSEKNIADSENMIVLKNQEKAELETELKELEIEYGDILTAIDPAKTALQAATADLAAKSDLLKEKNAEKSVLDAKKVAQEQLVTDVKGNVEAIEKKIDNKLEAIKKAKKAIIVTEQSILTKQDELADGVVDKAEKEAEIKEAEAKLAESKKELAAKEVLAAEYDALLQAALK
ncbi:MAG: hypothetical protein JEZ14_20900 [Marinilabiliaceae bacterium]|nr:hypothetical protein [Marinilabiliaceae bacterium]